MRWVGQQQRRQRLRLLRDQRATVAVGRDGKASGHVVAEERDRRSVSAVAYRQRAASAGRVRRIGERRLRAEGDVRQVDAAVRVEAQDRTAVDGDAAGNEPGAADEDAAAGCEDCAAIDDRREWYCRER